MKGPKEFLTCSVIVLATLAANAEPARASVTTDRLCGLRGGVDGDSFPDASAMMAAASLAETRLEQERQDTGRLSGALAALEIPTSGAEPPPSEAIARYCAAAGEVMRLSIEGSQLQAQNYLLTALRESRNSGTPQLTSRAAYRLGLVSLQGAPVAGVRGAGRVRRSGSAIVRQLRSAQGEEGAAQAACASLTRARPEESSNAFMSALALDCAARLALESGDVALSALASLRLARFGLGWAESASDPEELRRLARESAVNAIPVAARIPDPQARAELLGRLIGTAIDLGGVNDPALMPGLAAMQASESADPAARAMAAALEARLAMARGDSARARLLLDEAILQESRRALPVRLPDHYLLLAEAEPERREQHVFAAYTALDNMRPLLPRIDPLTEESIFSLHMRRVFETAVDVQLAGGGIQEEGRIRTAQQIVEAYRQAELLNAVGSECLPPRNPVRPEDLVAGETLLYPLLLDDRVELLFVSGSDRTTGAAQFRRLPPNRTANRRSVTRLVEDLVLSMSYGEDEAWRAPARALYDLLIKPIEDQLAPGTTLAIIPDGPLRALPFAALVDTDGRFLVQRTALSVAPALAYSQPGGRDTDGELSVVAASLQQEVTLPAGTFSALQGTAGEARIAAENGAPGRLIPDFRKADLVAALDGESVDVLHLATHASFNGRSDRAFIVANGEAIRLSELRDMIAENRRRGDALDLLVLSACETAVGDDEASMGLAGAAVQAGATSAIASLWQVDDQGTAELMRQFYGRYRTGASRSSSMRDAQLALIEGGGDNANPNIWAAFTLLGAWR